MKGVDGSWSTFKPMTLPGELVQTERMDPVEKRVVPQHFFN
jgi:hypothetical protein